MNRDLADDWIEGVLAEHEDYGLYSDAGEPS